MVNKIKIRLDVVMEIASQPQPKKSYQEAVDYLTDLLRKKKILPYYKYYSFMNNLKKNHM